MIFWGMKMSLFLPRACKQNSLQLRAHKETYAHTRYTNRCEYEFAQSAYGDDCRMSVYASECKGTKFTDLVSDEHWTYGRIKFSSKPKMLKQWMAARANKREHRANAIHCWCVRFGFVVAFASAYCVRNIIKNSNINRHTLSNTADIQKRQSEYKCVGMRWIYNRSCVSCERKPIRNPYQLRAEKRERERKNQK